MDGWRPGAESRLFGPDRASWHFSVYRDGVIEQHYETEDVCWHCGAPGNLYYIGIEHEGSSIQPLTPTQYQATLNLQRWLFAQHPEWGQPELRKNLWEHGWLMATDCPSGRIPWERLLADLKEDGDMTEQQVKDIFASMMWPRFGPAYHTTRATAAALDGKGQEFKEQIELAIKSAQDWNLWPKEA
jgi:N-acetyl-anhydromuramyl-L-alanine amidase AmpD